MAMTVDAFLDLDRDAIVKLASLQKCRSCHRPLQETITGCRKTRRGYLCSDCYFKELGEGVERHPIGIPRMHRGR